MTVKKTLLQTLACQLSSILMQLLFSFYQGIKVKKKDSGKNSRLSILTNPYSTDHSPFRKTFELGIFTSTAGKSILNLKKIVKFGCKIL